MDFPNQLWVELGEFFIWRNSSRTGWFWFSFLRLKHMHCVLDCDKINPLFSAQEFNLESIDWGMRGAISEFLHFTNIWILSGKSRREVGGEIMFEILSTKWMNRNTQNLVLWDTIFYVIKRWEGIVFSDLEGSNISKIFNKVTFNAFGLNLFWKILYF